MTPTEARACLERAGLNQSSLARLLIELEDERSLPTVQRGIRRSLAPDKRGKISWQMAGLLRVLAMNEEVK